MGYFQYHIGGRHDVQIYNNVSFPGPAGKGYFGPEGPSPSYVLRKQYAAIPQSSRARTVIGHIQAAPFTHHPCLENAGPFTFSCPACPSRRDPISRQVVFLLSDKSERRLPDIPIRRRSCRLQLFRRVGGGEPKNSAHCAELSTASTRFPPNHTQPPAELWIHSSKTSSSLTKQSVMYR